MSFAVSQSRRQSTAELWLISFAAILVLQGLIIHMLSTTGRQYGLNWQAYHAVISGWMGISIFLLPLAGFGGVVVAARAGGTWKLRMAVVLLGAGLLAGLLSLVFWYGLALGSGSQQTVATVRMGETNYSLEYVVAGDPPATRYDLRECSLDGWWCREIGGVYGYMRSADAEPSSIERYANGDIQVIIGGKVRAVVKAGRIECRETDTLFCPN